jgi:hypothetical protein
MNFIGLRKEALGFKMSHLAQWQFDPKMPVIDADHGRVEPITSQWCFSVMNFSDDFPTPYAGVADIGPQPGISPAWFVQG